MLQVRDGSVDTVFHGRAKHIPVEDPNREVQVERKVVVESMDFSSKGTKVEDSETEMVVRKTMTVNRFLLGGRPTPSQQAPPPPLSPLKCKRSRNTFEPTNCQEDAPSKTSLAPTTEPLVIREPAQEPRPTMVVGSNSTSFSAPPIVGWQSVFRL